MMNDQVRDYFRDCRFRQVCEIFRENNSLDIEPEGPYIYLFAEGVGEGVKIPVTQEDLKFVHRVQFLFRKQGNPSDSVPESWRVLATKYALLHPAPLHNYTAKWDNADNKLKIYETRRIGRSSRTEDHHVAEVGPQMYEVYAKANGKAFDASTGQITGMPPGKDTDEQVAKWWMEENKDCLQDYGKGIPSPQVKIIRRGTSSVSLAFRANTKEKFGTKWKYQWYTVKDVPIDMGAFRSHVEEHGFDELLHAGHIVRFSPMKWQRIMEPDKIGKGGKEKNPALKQSGAAGFGIPHPKLKDMDIRPMRGYTVGQVKDMLEKKEAELNLNDEGKGDVTYQGKKIARVYAPHYLIPGHQEMERDSSDEFNRIYSTDDHFKKVIDDSIKGAVSSYISRRGIPADSHTVNDITQSTFMRFAGRTRRIPDEDWKNWRTLLGDDWKCRKQNIETNTPFGNKLCQMIGGSAQTEVGKAFGLGRAGGVRTTVARGTSGEEQKRGLERSTTDSGDSATDDVKALNTPEALLAYIQDDMSSIRNPAIQAKVKQFADKNPILAKIAAGLDHLSAHTPEPQQQQPDFDDDYSDDDDDYSDRPGSMGRYNRMTANREESHSPYSFRAYVQKRLDEMGVAWGNDKASAKRLKPHQTLKGGIQVFGAPWTAGGGPNNPDNDVKVKG